MYGVDEAPDQDERGRHQQAVRLVDAVVRGEPLAAGDGDDAFDLRVRKGVDEREKTRHKPRARLKRTT